MDPTRPNSIPRRTRVRPRRPSAPPSGSTEATARKRLLVADDDPGVRSALEDLLTGEGYVVIAAQDGEHALACAASTPLDLVLLDLKMPGPSGWDVFERLTREHPLLPIIVITARANQSFTALGAGADALLEKPLEIPVLLNTVARLLAEPRQTHLSRLAGVEAPFAHPKAQPRGAGAPPDAA